MATIRFQDTVVEAEAGRDLLSQLLDAEAPIAYLCMSGSCGTCRVRVRSGGEHLEPLANAERRRLGRTAGAERLACQAICIGSGDVVVDQDFGDSA